MFGFALVLGSLRFYQERFGEIGNLLRLVRTAVCWSGIVLVFIVGVFYFDGMKLSYEKIFRRQERVVPLSVINSNPLYSYLKEKVPARSKIVNLDRDWFPVAVVSNNFVTFPGNIRKHYFSSPAEMARGHPLCRCSAHAGHQG